MTYMSAGQNKNRPSHMPHPVFQATEPMILAALDYLGSTARPLPEAVAAALAPVGGVPYLEWLFLRLMDRLSADERAILVGLLGREKRAAIGDRLGHDRNWVTTRMKARLAPQLVTLINAAVTFPCFRYAAMLGVERQEGGAMAGDGGH